MKICLVSTLLTLLMSVLSVSYINPAVLSAEGYIVDYSTVNITERQISKPTGIEALYPMSPEAEADIVHVVPSCPVNVDGVWYEAKDITGFNGRRLRFANSQMGDLCAFTTAEGLENFIETEYGETVWGADQEGGAKSTSELESIFFDEWWYGGLFLRAPPGGRFPDLATYNDIFSSAKIGDSAGVYIFEHIDYGGDYFFMAAGSPWSMLSLQGWNDRASSIWAL